jgi:hypothetical protein
MGVCMGCPWFFTFRMVRGNRVIWRFDDLVMMEECDEM